MRFRSLLLLVLSAGCGSAGADTALNPPVIDTLPGGIPLVKNTGPTRWADTSGWKLVLERTIAPEDASPAELGQPGGIVADSRGNVYVLDNKPAGIKVFDAGGAYVRTIGREGAGPGEFRPYGMLMISRDTIVHHDSRQSRTQAFTTDGQFIRVWKTSCCHSRPLLATTDGIFPIPGTITPDTTGGATAMFSGAGVVRYRIDGTVVDTMVFPPEPDQPYWKMGDKENWSINTIPFQPGIVTRFLPDGTLLWGLQGSYRLMVSRTGLDTLRIFEWTAGSTPIPDSLRSKAVADQIAEDERWRGVARLDDVPRSYPVWTSAIADGAGNIWVLVPGPRGESDHWDVFDPTGVLLGAVPAMFDGTYRTYWTADRVYSIGEGDDGIPVIKVWRIAKAQPAR